MSDIRYSTIEGEICQNCGKKFKIVWEVSDSVWKSITNQEEGILCPECFDSLAAFKGITLQWIAYSYKKQKSGREGRTS